MILLECEPRGKTGIEDYYRNKGWRCVRIIFYICCKMLSSGKKGLLFRSLEKEPLYIKRMLPPDYSSTFCAIPVMRWLLLVAPMARAFSITIPPLSMVSM